MKEHLEGYLDALHDMDLAITEYIKENGGAKSPLQIINVFNQFISKLHYVKMNVQEEYHDLIEASLEDEDFEVKDSDEEDEDFPTVEQAIGALEEFFRNVTPISVHAVRKSKKEEF